MNQICCDAFNELDDEIKQEFYEDVQAAIKDINECANLLESGADAQVIDRMFRSLHTVKGNCNMVFLSEFVDASHKLEDLFSDIRSGEIEYNDSYGQFAVVAVNAIEGQMQSLLKHQKLDGTILKKLEKIIDEIEESESENRVKITEKAIIAIQDRHFNLDLVAIDKEHGRVFSFLDATDLEFFEFISNRKAEIEPNHQEFISICETLALKINAKLGRSIEEQQIKVAIIFIAFSRALASRQSSTDLEIEQVFFASGLLNRMAGWNIAAEITLQLLENHDGTGSPLGLKDEEIAPAAQAIALAVEFSLTVMNNQSQGYKQALFTAVKQINAQKGVRYKERLIERFTQVIKSDYLNAQMW